MNSRFRVAAATVLALPALVLAQAQLPTKEPAKEPAKPAAPAAPARADGPVATVNGIAIPRQRAEFVVKQQTARGAQEPRRVHQHAGGAPHERPEDERSQLGGGLEHPALERIEPRRDVEGGGEARGGALVGEIASGHADPGDGGRVGGVR